jgi:hypothetical protein
MVASLLIGKWDEPPRPFQKKPHFMIEQNFSNVGRKCLLGSETSMVL